MVKFELLFLCFCTAASLGFSNKKQNLENTDGLLFPSVTTDKNDYPPGSTVHISGCAFLPGENVTLLVSHLDSTVTDGEGHAPWTVTASARGEFASSWAVPYDDNLGEVLKISATGQTSRSQATALFVDANSQLTLTTHLPDTLCPGEALDVCANLSQRCGGGYLVPLANKKLIFYLNAGDCGANVGQNGEDTVQTDNLGNACFAFTAPQTSGELALRVKFQGETKPVPCPPVGNSVCNPYSPIANKRCTNLSSANICATYFVDSSGCMGCRAPVLTCPGAITRGNDPGQCGAAVDFNISAGSRCGPVTVACVPPSGTFFLVGTTNVNCAATDTAENSSTCSFSVTVQDTEPPQVFHSANISVSNSPGQTSVPVSFSASALDNCASTPVVCSPPSGSLFPVGVTAVTCTAEDASHNSSAGSFAVTVNSILFFHRDGTFAGDQLGYAVAGGGDVNGDGFIDFLVTIPGADIGGSGNSAALPDAGAVELFSGANGQPLLQLNGVSEGDRLGGSAGISGDVNGDGYADFIVGSPDATVNSMPEAGAAYVYSGADGSLLFEIKGATTADRLGGSVGIIGDINGDGHDDFIVTAPGKDVGGTGSAGALENAGAVYVYSGADGSLLYQINGEFAANRLGGSIGVSGDVDDDGTEDFIVGAPEAQINGMADAGAAYVFSGKNGRLLFSTYGSAPGDELGSSVSISGNVDGKPGDDIVIGSPGRDLVAAGASIALVDAGAVYVYSGLDGSLLYQDQGTHEADRLGGSAGISGDVNGDGNDDYYAAAPFADPNGLVDAGTVTVYSGADGQPIFKADGTSSGDLFGSSVSLFKSAVDGGAVRFLIGAPGTDLGTQADAGSAFVYQIAHKGDLNGDGRLTPADIVLLLNCIFMERGFCPPEIADMNCDGSLVSPTDIVILLNASFLNVPVTCVQ